MSEKTVVQPIVGILGGSSHIVTTTYYDRLNTELRRALGGQHIAETLIRGMNFGNVAGFARAGDWSGLTEYVGQAVDDLERGGAQLIMGCSNTVHEVMGQVMASRKTEFLPISTPLIHAVQKSQAKKIVMFGTKSTMANGQVMRELRKSTGAELLVPNTDEQEDINKIIFAELCERQFLPASRDRYLQIARRLITDEGADGLILGCTEIMLLIEQNDLPEISVFPTGQLHIEAAAQWVIRQLKDEFRAPHTR